MSLLLFTKINEQFEGHKGAVILMIAATLLTSVAIAINKSLATSYSVSEMVLWRSIFSIPIVAALIFYRGGIKSLRTQNPIMLSLRGFFGFLAISLYCFSLQSSCLFSTETLFRLSPIFVFFMAIFILREKLELSSIIVLMISILGAFLVIFPDIDYMHGWAIPAIGASLFYAIEIIVTRISSQKNSVINMYIYYTVICLVCSFVVVDINVFDLPMTPHIPLLVAMALLNLGINLCFSEALRRSPASKLAPLEYLTIPWVTLWGYWFWQDLPDMFAVVGGMVILGSGLWVLNQSMKLPKMPKSEELLASIQGEFANASGNSDGQNKGP